MNNDNFDRLMEEALNIPLPQGLAGRLEKQIDAYAAREKSHKTHRLYRLAGLAALMLLCIGIFLQTGRQPHTPADTFADPAEAAAAAEHTLAFVSAQLNKGLEQVSNAGQEFEKVNEILNKHLK
jgi:cytochrome c-type biogenesis protein CcmH/NrfG